MKEKDPLKYSFLHLKHRARQRGHEFTLTLEEYRAFALKSGYAEAKGKTATSLSIDRKDETKGYSADNIRAISLRGNTRRRYSNMPQWLKDEMAAAERGVVPASHAEIGVDNQQPF